MKLTIEAVYEKFIGRTEKFPEHFEDFAADIQAYVKQEMGEIVEKSLGEVFNMDNGKTNGSETEFQRCIGYGQALKNANDTFLTAIENYGKDKL